MQGCRYRRLTDAQGECGTLCTVIFDRAAEAAAVAAALGTTTVAQSGWHVLANMDHVNRHLRSAGIPCGPGAYPQTDDLLARSINLSVGVIDAGLGAAFGIDINAGDVPDRGGGGAIPRRLPGGSAERRITLWNALPGPLPRRKKRVYWPPRGVPRRERKRRF